MNQIPRFIFIGGCPRSGTTFLASMLAGNPNFGVIPEMLFKYAILKWDFNKKQGSTNESVLDLFERLRASKWTKSWPIQIRGDMINNINEKNDQISAEGIVWALSDIFLKSKNLHTYKYIVEHSPRNIKDYDLIKSCFSKPIFIHIIRDGRAIYNSVKPLDWGPNDPIRAARFWTENVKQGLALKSKNDVITIRYEDLLNGSFHELIDSINTYLRAEMTVPDFNSPQAYFITEYTKNQHRKVGHHSVKTSRDKWKEKLSIREVEIFEYFTKDLLESLGYQAINDSPAPPNYVERLKYSILGALKSRINKYKIKQRRNNHNQEVI